MPRRRPAIPVDDGPHLVVHPDWLTHVSGVCAPVVCDIRPATEPDLVRAGELLVGAGRDDVVAAHAAGTSVVLVAWIDPEIVVPDHVPPHSRSARVTEAAKHGPTDSTRDSSRRLTVPELSAASFAAGFVELRWAGPADVSVHDLAGDCVELIGPYVDRHVRRRGIGRALLAAAGSRCLLAGRPRIVSRLGPVATSDGRPGGSGTVGSSAASSWSTSIDAPAGPGTRRWSGPGGDHPTSPVTPAESVASSTRSAAVSSADQARRADDAGYRPLCPCVVRAEVVGVGTRSGPAVRVRRSAADPGLGVGSRGAHLRGAGPVPPPCQPGDCPGSPEWWVRDVVDPTATIRTTVGRARRHP